MWGARSLRGNLLVSSSMGRLPQAASHFGPWTMEKARSIARLVRFGVFEVDLRAGELRKNGVKIKVQEQAFQILAMLLEHPGQIVTRGELQQKLWSNDTFVDFDNSLNKAVNKIREALGDSADNPRFLETMARRGYRFIAPVDGSVTTGEAPKPPVTATAPMQTRRRLVVMMGIVVLLIASVGVTWWLARPPSTPPLKQVLIRLTSDAGLTTDPALSPDGKLLAYASDRSGQGNLDIWLKQIAGGEPLRLTKNKEDDREPVFSPDGSLIAFVSGRDGGGIYTVSALGGEERLVVKSGVRPRFSPDGRWIAFYSDYPELKTYVVSATGGLPKPVAPDFHVALDPIWAPDGNHLLFLGSRAVGATENPETMEDWWV